MEKSFSCDMCIKSYRNNSDLQSHRQYAHMGIKQHVCPFCDKSYVDQTRLKIHMETGHTDKGSFKCSSCDKEYPYEYNLKQHTWRKHLRQTKTVKCDYCDKMIDKYQIKIHLQQHLDCDSGKYKCDKCDVKCSSRSGLRKHLLTHEVTEKLFNCDQCNKTYKAKHSLYLHVKYIHKGSEKGKWICKVCDKEFAQSGTLTIHEKTHNGERFECLACDKTFAYKHSLKLHMKIHTDNLKVCTICDKKLSPLTSMANHMETHITGKKFKCDYCTNEYSQKDNLKAHVKSIHLKVSNFCNQCDFVTNCKSSLSSHKRNKHSLI